MSLSITTNIPSLFAQNALSNTTSALDTSLQRLSTGLKINSGADGPAALVISQQQQAQIAGLQTAIDNTSKATDLVQTADGALGTISNLLVQIRGLALDSANAGVQDAPALQANQSQINNALQTIDNIAANTQFGTKQILNGSAGFGASSTDQASFTGLGATSVTTPGVYTVTTSGAGDTSAAKGTVAINPASNGNLSTTTNLSANETLTIVGPNGTATVALTASETLANVEIAINAATNQTGVVASTSASNGLELQAQNYGQNFTVQSTVAAGTAGSSGVGTTLINTASTATAGIYTITAGSSLGEQNAQKGALTVNVGTSGAGTAFVSNVTNLANNEILTLTGPTGQTATIALAQGSTNTQVAADINNYTSLTGVVADTGATNGGLRLYTQQFGQNFSVSESLTGGGSLGNGSLGIGSTTVNTGAGNNTVANPANANFVVTVGQNAVVKITNTNNVSQIVTGSGATITASTGNAAGLTFTLNPSTANPFVTTAVAGSPITVANGTLTFQIGANAGQTASVSIPSVAASNLGIVSGNQFANLQQINVTTTAGAQSSIAVVDAAINDISTLSGALGAFQTNTLQATASNLQATLTNTQSAESTIVDTNYSSEIANFTQLQVQEQAGVSVLGLANQIPQNVLTLLQKL
jgi:flagellin